MDGTLVLGKARAYGVLKVLFHVECVHVQDLLVSEEAVGRKALNYVERAEYGRVVGGEGVKVHANRRKLERDALLASGIGSDGTQSATGSLHLQATKLEAGNGRIAASNILEIHAAENDLSRAQDNDQAGV
ncbi:hypothetical protein, partial [Bartonella taylorii]|uniref:hypothetical protein n=1 Tax=Bartonella taylorii TaxID=33046 RepID=UPI001ABB7942